MLSEAKLTNLEVSTSDHCPLWLEPQVASTVVRTKAFRFINAWLREPMCYQLAEDVWNSNLGNSFYDKLSQCSQILSAWVKDITCNFKRRIHHSTRILRMLKGRRDENSIKVVKEERKNLNEIYV